jgi:hypothetical protein
MDDRVARLKTSHDARKLAENARQRGFADLANEALQRGIELRAHEDGYTSPAEQAIAAALYAYEEQQTRIKGKTFIAGRTRQMLAKRGALGAAANLVLSPRPSSGFAVLEGAGLQVLTFEAIIDRFPNEFSPQVVDAARARLEGRPPPSSVKTSSDGVLNGTNIVLSTPSLDAEAAEFVEGFQDPTTWFLTRWMPRYRETIGAIATSLDDGRPEDTFDLIWKRQDNSISHAGQGLLKYETVDKMRHELTQVIRDIHDDDGPANFERVVQRFEGWKGDGRINMVPRLLVARAFAGIHPRRYHTTVDADSQSEVLKWFVEHTGLVLPRETDWASRAQALTLHLDYIGAFGNDILARNMFPWFVIDQLRARATPPTISPGHSPRPTSAFSDLPSTQRAIQLRHNAVQTKLFDVLVEEFGEGTVWTEHPTGTGGYADAIVRTSDGRCTLYEIKIANTAAQVVRLAMGQLLEYGFRAGGLEPARLVVVGEPPLDNVTRRFIGRLREDFKLPIDYMRVTVPDDLELDEAGIGPL